MIKSWWAEKSTSEKQIVAALAVLSLGVFLLAWGDKTDRYLHCRASVPRAKN